MKNENQRYLYAKTERGDLAYKHNPFSLPSVIKAIKIALNEPKMSKLERSVMVLWVSQFYVLLLWLSCILAGILCLANNAERIAESTGLTFLTLTAIMVVAFAHLCICGLLAKNRTGK